MKIYLDTEFNSFKGELISIGMVSGDKKMFYAVRAKTLLMDIDNWVEENVMPQVFQGLGGTQRKLGYEGDSSIRQRLESYLNQWGNVDLEIISDWPEDTQHLCDMLITGPGEMITTPNVVKFIVDRTLNGVSEVPHHALFDAIGNMEQDEKREDLEKDFSQNFENNCLGAWIF